DSIDVAHRSVEPLPSGASYPSGHTEWPRADFLPVSRIRCPLTYSRRSIPPRGVAHRSLGPISSLFAPCDPGAAPGISVTESLIRDTSVPPGSVDELERLLAAQQYVADRGLVISVYLALMLKRPLFLEGEAGVGKTEIAK